jgi:arsenate reductase
MGPNIAGTEPSFGPVPGKRSLYLSRRSAAPPPGRPRIPVSQRMVVAMEVQVFGTKKCQDTRKALRFFAERRVKTHFVDLQVRAASLGELRRFAQKFGVAALVDRGGKRFADLGLRSAALSEERWLERLADDPGLLRTPLVRRQNALTIGAAEATWKEWVAS